uniref:hypothetical protein n=1 Tax=Fulvivirga sp. TaxID=1931237 RepID=UPI004049F305
MKKLFIAIALIAVFSNVSNAQTKLNEKTLMGVWQLKFDVTEDDIKDAAEDEDNLLAKALIKGVASFVGGILEEIDIKFEFQPKNRVLVIVNAFDESSDDEYTTWEITKEGHLIIGDTKNFQTNNDNTWELKDGILVNIEVDKSNNEKQNVYMVKIN